MVKVVLQHNAGCSVVFGQGTNAPSMCSILVALPLGVRYTMHRAKVTLHIWLTIRFLGKSDIPAVCGDAYMAKSLMISHKAIHVVYTSLIVCFVTMCAALSLTKPHTWSPAMPSEVCGPAGAFNFNFFNLKKNTI